MRVLLVSPVRGLDPANGDVTYTEELVGNPPPGVAYTTYAEAIENGTLRRVHRRIPGVAPSVRTILEGTVNRLRRRGLLFREPFSYFSVQAGAYDLVHVHTFSVGWIGDAPPLVVSNAAPIDFVYRDAAGWSESRVRAGGIADRLLARASDVKHSTYSSDDSIIWMSLTQALAAWRADHRISTLDEVVPNFVAEPPGLIPAEAETARIGLIASEPILKGADVFLDAVSEVRRTGDQADFFIIGSTSGQHSLLDRAGSLGVEWYQKVPRRELLDRVLPGLTALAYPSRFDGAPFVLLEALSRGVPILASDYFALPDMVGCAGLVHHVGDHRALAGHMREVIVPARRAELSKAATARYQSDFTPATSGERLLRLYRKAMQNRRTCSGNC